MPVYVISKIKQKNDQKFKLMDAGDIEVSVSPTETTDLQTTVDDLKDSTANLDSAALKNSGNQVLTGDLLIKKEGEATGDLTVQGNLNVKGTTVTTAAETLAVKDNLIITNAEGTPLSTSLSGIAIKTGKGIDGDPDPAYAIVYDPANDPKGDSVRLGLGLVSADPNNKNEFIFNENEGSPIAVRSNSANIKDKNLMQWDGTSYKLVDSGISKTSIETNLNAKVEDVTKAFEAADAGLQSEIKNNTTELKVIASPSTLGRIKVGNDFDIADDGTLSLYKHINIDSFYNDKSSNAKGSTVSEVTFSWAINKTPLSLSLAGESIEPGLKTKTISNQNITTNTSFELVAADNKNSVSRRSYVNFYNYVVCGAGAEFNPDTMSKELRSNNMSSFTVDATGDTTYIYYAIPESFPEPHFYVGPFEGGFTLQETKQIGDGTKIGFMTTKYKIYKSNNPNLGNTTVEIK